MSSPRNVHAGAAAGASASCGDARGALGATAAALAADGWVLPGRPGAVELLRALVGYPALVWRHRDLVRASVGRELAARWRGSMLGFLWALAQPLLLLAVYGFLFTRVLGLRVLPRGAGADGFAAGWLLVGVLAWSGFAEGVLRATGCVVEHRGLVQKLRFPCELLPLHAVLAAHVTAVAGLALYALAASATPFWPSPGPAFAWAPLLILLQLLLTTGLGLFFAACHVGARDTQPLVGSLVTVALFATPVFWAASPALLPGIDAWLPWVEANPLHHLIQGWRCALLAGGPEELYPGGAAHAVARLAPWAVGLFALGFVVYRRRQRHFADEV